MFFVNFDYGMAIFNEIDEAAAFLAQHAGSNCILRAYPDAEQWQGCQWMYRNHWEKLVGGELGDVDITLPSVDDLRNCKVFEPYPRPIGRLGKDRLYAVIGWDKAVLAILSTADVLPDFIRSSGADYVEVTEVATTSEAYTLLNSRLYGSFAFAMAYGTSPYCPIRGLEADVIYRSPATACFQQLLGQVPEAMQSYCNQLQTSYLPLKM